MIGTLESLSPNTRKPKQWFTRFSIFSRTNKLLTTPAEGAQPEAVTAANKDNTSLLLTYMDSQMFSLVNSLVSPDNILDKTIEELETVICEHLEPKRTKHTQRYVFSKTMQKVGESINDFVARLRIVAEDCTFGQEYQSRMLDQFISGLSNSSIKQKLLGKTDLNLKTAIEKAVAEEKIRNEAQLMNSTETHKLSLKGKEWKNKATPSAPVYSGQSKPAQIVCAKCQLKGHYANKCRTRCYRCKSIGHIRRFCKSKQHRSSQHHLDGVSDSDQESATDSDDKGEYVTSEGNTDQYPVPMHKMDLLPGGELENSVSDLIVFKSFDLNSNDCNISSNSSKLNHDEIDLKVNSNNLNVTDLNIECDTLFESGTVPECGTVVECGTITEHKCELSFLNSKCMLNVILNGKFKLPMEFDSGSQVSCCSVKALVGSGMVSSDPSFLETLAPSNRTLKSANGLETGVVGKLNVCVQFNGQSIKDLALYVVQGEFPSLMGRSWIEQFLGEGWLKRTLEAAREEKWRLDKAFSSDKDCSLSSSCVRSVVDSSKVDSSCLSKCNFSSSMSMSNRSKVCSLSSSSVCQRPVGDAVPDPVDKDKDQMLPVDPKLLSEERWINQVLEERITITDKDVDRCLAVLKLNKIFDPSLGLIRGVEARLTLKEDARPVNHKARPIPFADRDETGRTLDEMEKKGVISKVEYNDWGSPIVIVKKNNKIRICGDYKATLNRNLETKHYPLPSLEDCFSRVSGGQKFTVIDIKSAYNNISIRKEDRSLTCITTHQGTYQFNRLPYGVNNSGPIFQETMDKTLENAKMTCCRVDDILISGKTREEHLKNVIEVVKRLEARGFRCNKEKSQFYKDKVVYLGHEVSAEGIRPVKSKVEDMLKAPQPMNLDSLVSFLGAVNYYRRYLPDLSTVIAPLEALRTTEWKWTDTEEKISSK